MSPAKTATHIHEANPGLSGPPRIAFPNPVAVGTRAGKEIRKSEGCMSGPFTTGVPVNGADSGNGFTVSRIEGNPAGFVADTHTVAFSAGAVRGQLLRSETPVKKPKYFTSVLKAHAVPDEVVDMNNNKAPGEKGAKGSFELSLNTHEDILCYKIELKGVSGDYLSPAKTATHVHFAAPGKSGPPRIAFPNPKKGWWGKRTSEGCIKGPFTTGIVANGADTGSASGFKLADLENNPAAFAADAHTVAFPAGVVRGQLKKVR